MDRRVTGDTEGCGTAAGSGVVALRSVLFFFVVVLFPLLLLLWSWSWMMRAGCVPSGSQRRSALGFEGTVWRRFVCGVHGASVPLREFMFRSSVVWSGHRHIPPSVHVGS